MGTKIELQVVGVTFVDSYPENFYRIKDIAEEYLSNSPAGWTHVKEGDGSLSFAMPEQITVLLIREPDNRYDPNAIGVHVPALGDDAKIGHIPKHVARWLAGELDEGKVWLCRLVRIGVHPDNPKHPGMTLELEPQT